MGQGREGCPVLWPPLQGSTWGQLPALLQPFLLVRPQKLPQACSPLSVLLGSWLSGQGADGDRGGAAREPLPLALGGGPLSSLELGPKPCFTDNGSGDHPGAETGLRVSRSYQPCSLELWPPTPYQTLCDIIQALAGSQGAEPEERKAGSVGSLGKIAFGGGSELAPRRLLGDTRVPGPKRPTRLHPGLPLRGDFRAGRRITPLL